jgi:hypothetical protein
MAANLHFFAGGINPLRAPGITGTAIADPASPVNNKAGPGLLLEQVPACLLSNWRLFN